MATVRQVNTTEELDKVEITKKYIEKLVLLKFGEELPDSAKYMLNKIKRESCVEQLFDKLENAKNLEETVELITEYSVFKQ